MKAEETEDVEVVKNAYLGRYLRFGLHYIDPIDHPSQYVMSYFKGDLFWYLPLEFTIYDCQFG